MVGRLRRLIRQREGQDLIEYALLASFVSITVLAGVVTLGLGVGDLSTGVFGRAVAALISAS